MTRSDVERAENAENAVEEGREYAETQPLLQPQDITSGNYMASQLGKEGKALSEPIPFPLNQSQFFSGLWETFGFKLLLMLFASQHLLKGLASSLIGAASQFLLASYNVAGPHMQVFGGVIQLPWAMKPIIGLVSDVCPIFGYNKRPYMLMASMLGIGACLAVAKIPQDHISVQHIVCCLFLMQLMFSTCDLLTEAKYAEKMQQHPQKGPDLMTYVWFGLQGGGLLATILVGPTMDKFGPKAPFFMALMPLAFILLPLTNNYMEENVRSPDQIQEDRRAILSQKEPCFLCLLMFASTMLLTGLGIAYEDVVLNCTAALIVAVVMLVAFSVVLRPVIAKVNAFFLLQTSLGFSIGGATFYFYTDSPEKYKDGPHFSMKFYTSVLGVVGSIFSLVGIATYQRYMKNWKYRDLLLMTNLVASGLAVFDVMLLSRMNIKLGIPDHIFVIGSSVFQVIIGQWMWMPGVVILSQLCPKGMEATMYALLAGCHNLGNTIASSSGALVLQYLGCNPSGEKGEDAQFDKLWIAAVLATIFPMFTLILLPLLIPDARQTDKILEDGDRDATAGSLWRRWTASRTE